MNYKVTGTLPEHKPPARRVAQVRVVRVNVRQVMNAFIIT